MMVTDGRRSAAFQRVEKELLPVGDGKVPGAFSSKEWKLLPYEDKLDFVRRKKDAVLFGIKSRMSSPVVSIICDLQDLEARMMSQEIKDGENDNPLSRDYMAALKLKLELARTIKALTDKGVVKHEHVIKKIQDDEVFDVNFEEVLNGSVLEEEENGE